MNMRFLRCLILGIILAFWVGALMGGSVFAAEKAKIILLPFVERNGEEPHWGYLIRDWVKRILEQSEAVEICDVFSTDNLVRASRISWDTLFVFSAAQTLGKRANGDYVLIGSFRHREVAGRDRII
ncbi:MAG: hypothetical protein ACPL7L_04535, partial [bacterium]